MGSVIMSLIHMVFIMMVSSGSGRAPAGLGAFTTLTAGLLVASLVLAFAGGVMAFNGRRGGGLLLLISAAICFFAHAQTRIYGGIYLLAGLLALFYPKFSRKNTDDYDDDEEEAEAEDEEEAEYEEEDDDRPRRPSANGAVVRLGVSRINAPVRVRSSKVCPSCGAIVDIDHKFCHECGETLRGPIRGPGEMPDFANDLGMPPPDEAQPNADSGSQRSAESSPWEPDVPTYGGDDEEEEEEQEATGTHRVFVSPARDDQPIPRLPIDISPDSSYQTFSSYARRRKRKSQRSVVRRVFGLLAVLLVLGGAGWFLFSLDKTPMPPVPVPTPPPPIENEPPKEAKPTADVLSALIPSPPMRGTILGSNVNIRPDHSATGSVVMKMNKGTQVDVLDKWTGGSGSQSGPWYKIRSGDGREGWIYGQYIQPMSSRETRLPTGYTAALLRTFGSDRAELVRHFGDPVRQTPVTLSWQGLSVNLRGDVEVTRMQITSARYILQNGVAVGVTDERLYETMGYPVEYQPSPAARLIYREAGNKLGVAVQIQNGKVQSLTLGDM
jgi:hypothetical protein